MKLFGKELFGFKKEPERMYDFAQFGLLQPDPFEFQALVQQVPLPVSANSTVKTKAKPVKTVKPASPKEVYEMKSLNNNNFTINVDTTYLAEQMDELEKKLSLYGKKPKNKDIEFGPVKYGREEVESVLERLANRKKLATFKTVVEQYPHTSSELIVKVLNKNNHLRCSKADDFVPDFPAVAVKAMKEYDDMCLKLCNKRAVFYVIADEKDFQQRNKRRDPILLAESPFGHFWQILGAWDKEMVFLGDL